MPALARHHSEHTLVNQSGSSSNIDLGPVGPEDAEADLAGSSLISSNFTFGLKGMMESPEEMVDALRKG